MYFVMQVLGGLTMQQRHHRKLPIFPGSPSHREKAPKISIFIHNQNNIKQPLNQQQEQDQQQRQSQHQEQEQESSPQSGLCGLLKKFCCGS